MMSQFTCIKCSVAFKNPDDQKQHYKSDWHKYNLKRRMVELPPITAEEFQKLINIQRMKNEEQLKDNHFYCSSCRKKIFSKNQYNNHLASKKHKENVDKRETNDKESSLATSINDTSLADNNSKSKKNNNGFKPIDTINEDDTDIETISVDTDEWYEEVENPILNNDCLFCDHHSRSLSRNIAHMRLAHSFSIPEPEHCIDKKGLLIYLGRKIFAEYICIWCNYIGKFRTLEAVRMHMVDKGHCRIAFNGEEMNEYTDFYNFSSKPPIMQMELAVNLDNEIYELMLPSRKVIGNRTLWTYYKQYLQSSRAIEPKMKKLRNVLIHYSAMSQVAKQKQVIASKIRDISYKNRTQAKHLMKLQVNANKLQCHFRKQMRV